MRIFIKFGTYIAPLEYSRHFFTFVNIIVMSAQILEVERL